MTILVARCQRGSALCPSHPRLNALQSRQWWLFGCLFFWGPSGDGLGPVLRGAEHLQLYLTSTGGAVSPAEAVPVQGLGQATRILHPLRPASSTAFLQQFSQPSPSLGCTDSQLWGLVVISINVGTQPWGFLPLLPPGHGVTTEAPGCVYHQRGRDSRLYFCSSL